VSRISARSGEFERILRTSQKAWEQLDSLAKLRRRKPMSYGASLQLWHAYYQNLLAKVGKDDRVLVQYDRVLENPGHELRRILAGIGLAGDPVHIKAAAAQGSLRHNMVAYQELEAEGIDPGIREQYLELILEAQDGAQ
jgi:hypothetical protein